MAETKQSIAVIPARGASKRLPRKNIKNLLGHPMLAYAIAGAQNSGLFERVVVSTDDPETGRIAEWYGAQYVDRPPELATDGATLPDVSIHVLDVLRQEGITPAYLCQLMPNCPLRRSQDILEHFCLFRERDCSFQITVVPYRAVYPHWAVMIGNDGEGIRVFDEYYAGPSQNLPETYCPTGAIWWVKTADFLAQGVFYGKPFHLAPMDANRGIDIDRMEEFAMAEIIALGLEAKHGVRALEPVNHEPFSR